MIDNSHISRINQIVSDSVISKIRQQLEIIRAGNTQPMNTTSRLSKSITAEEQDGWISDVEIKAEDYGSFLDTGILGANVPFTAGSGAPPSSAYIQNLAVWAAQKFYGGNYQQGLKAAFAIAKTQKKNGAPANKGWIEEIKNELEDIINKQYDINVYKAIELDVNRILNITIP